MSKLNYISLIFKNFLFILLLEVFTVNAAFCEDDHIFINSESLAIDRNDNVANFKGEVILWFDKILLKTEQIKITYKKAKNSSSADSSKEKNSIDNIIIPHKLRAYNSQTDQVIIADSAEYLHDQAKLTFLGNVILQQKARILKTSKLIYYTKLKQSNKFNISR